jgi:YaiO family outer membrane protein
VSLLIVLLVVIAVTAGAQTTPDPLAEARALVRAGKLEEAVAAYTRVLEANPGALEVRTERGRVLGWLQRFPEALADFDAVLAVMPRDVDTRIARSRVLAYAKRYGEAEAEARRALADDPKAVEAHLALGDFYAWQEKFEEATAALEQARALVPQAPEPWLGLAKVRLWQEDLKGATEAYEAALRLDPGNVDAKEGLARIAAIPPTRRFRLDLGYVYENLSSGLSDWHSEAVRLSVRLGRKTRVIVGVEQFHRFDVDDTQVNVGIVQSLPADITVYAAYTHGFDAQVVARDVFEAEVGYRLTSWATALLAYRHMEYLGDVSADVITPGLELTWAPWVSLRARYYYSKASNQGGGSAFAGQLTFKPEGPVSVYVGGAYGRETFQAGTVVEVLRSLDVVTLTGGVSWRVTDWMGVRVDYAYEDRITSYTKHSLGTSVFFEF